MLITELLLSIISLITTTHFLHHLNIHSNCCSCCDFDIFFEEKENDDKG